MRYLCAAVLGFGVLGLGGCAFQGAVNPTHFKYEPRSYDAAIKGRALIEMPRAVQDEQFTGKPTSLTGAVTNLTLPIGEITREAATLAFKDVFSEGVKVVESASGQIGHVAVVRPWSSQFSYEYNALKNAGFAITPTAAVGLNVSLLSSDMKLVFTRNFSSGNVEGPTYVLSGSPGDEVSKAAHQAMMKVMQEAADATYQELKKGQASGGAKGDTAM